MSQNSVIEEVTTSKHAKALGSRLLKFSYVQVIVMTFSAWCRSGSLCPWLLACALLPNLGLVLEASSLMCGHGRFVREEALQLSANGLPYAKTIG